MGHTHEWVTDVRLEQLAVIEESLYLTRESAAELRVLATEVLAHRARLREELLPHDAAERVRSLLRPVVPTASSLGDTQTESALTIYHAVFEAACIARDKASQFLAAKAAPQPNAQDPALDDTPFSDRIFAWQERAGDAEDEWLEATDAVDRAVDLARAQLTRAGR